MSFSVVIIDRKYEIYKLPPVVYSSFAPGPLPLPVRSQSVLFLYQNPECAYYIA